MANGRHLQCDKCGGSGRLAHYQHIDEGVCFKCLGTGKMKASKKQKTTQPNPESIEIAERIVKEIASVGLVKNTLNGKTYKKASWTSDPDIFDLGEHGGGMLSIAFDVQASGFKF